MASVIVNDDRVEQIEEPLKSPEMWLRRPIYHLEEASDKSGENSEYRGPAVYPENMYVWKDFVTGQDIKSQLEQKTLTKLKAAFTESQREKFTWGDPECGLNVNEASFVNSWAPVTQGINLILKMMSEKESEKGNAAYAIIGDGDVAKWKAPEYNGKNYNVGQKKADYSTYKHMTPETHKILGAENIFNRIPGDAKIYGKIRHSMLPPNGQEFIVNPKAQFEAMKVLKQIYNYMDQHEARYGYVVNNKEIVFFRRRPHYWGHMDISPPIKHKVEADLDKGILNSKYVLFYFLHVIAMDESKWRLESCIMMVPTRDQISRNAKRTALRLGAANVKRRRTDKRIENEKKAGRNRMY